MLDFKVSSFFCFLVGKFVENFMVGHCHFFLLFVFVGILDIVWFGLKSLCGHVVFFALGHFWIVEFFGIVKYRQCWSSMKLCIVCSLWYCWMNFDLIFMGMKSWEFDVYGNFVGMCRPYFHGYGNFTGIIFMGMENFLCWTYVWVIIEWIYGDEVLLGWLRYCLDVMEFECVEWHLGFS